jgi:UDP-N-acetylmuramate dehydrogenase
MGALSDALAALETAVAGRVERDAWLGSSTTYRVGGRVAARVVADSVADLAAIGRIVATTGAPVVVVGRGSNLLVADRGYEGIVVVGGEGLAHVSIDGTVVRAGGAALLPVVARRTAAAGLTGFEWAVGVPGTIGGGVRMNAGGHGSDMAASLTRVLVVDLRTGEYEWMSVAALELGFRHSVLTSAQIVAEAELTLDRGDAAGAEAMIAEIVRWRRENQPGGANAGSVFRNPRPDSAGRLLDEVGVKGWRVGGAQISEKHANFIQVDEGGSASDVAELMIRTRRTVLERTGVDLRAETHFLGFPPEIASAAGAVRIESGVLP